MEDTQKRTADSSQILPFGEKFAYAMGDFASNLFWMPFVLYGAYFYTDVFGISATATGWMLLITRIWDTVNDPVMGLISDRTRPHSKLGKYRPFLFWVAVPFGFVAAFAFFTPNLPPTMKLVYAWVTYALFGMIYTAINIPYSALMSVMSKEPGERNSTSFFRMVGAQVAGLLVSSSLLLLVEKIGGEGNPQRGFFVVMGGAALLAVVCFMATGLWTRERIEPEVKASGETLRDMLIIFTSWPWWVLFFVSFFTIAAFTMRFGVAAYYFKYYADQQALESWGTQGGGALTTLVTVATLFVLVLVSSYGLLERTFKKASLPMRALIVAPFVVVIGITVRFCVNYYYAHGSESFQGGAVSAFFTFGTIASLLGTVVFTYFAKTLDKKRMYYALIIVSGLISVYFYFIPNTAITTIIVTQMVFSFLTAPTGAILFAMYTDIAAHIRHETGSVSNGLVMSAGSLSQKFGWAVGGALTSLLLGWAGYVANMPQSEEVKLIMSFMMSWAPMISCLLGAAFMLLYPLDNARMEVITNELEAGITKANDGETRASLGQRWLGRLIDTLLVVGVTVVGVLMGRAFTHDPSASFTTGALLGLVVLVAQWTLIAKKGKSVGKYVVKTTIRRVDGGQPPGFLHGVVLREWVVGGLASIPYVGGVVGLADALFIFGRDRQCLHDKIARTVVEDDAQSDSSLDKPRIEKDAEA